MSDGNEEREETKTRKEQEKRQDHEDWIDHAEPEEWQPERVDS